MKKREKFLDYKNLIKSSLLDVIKHALKKTSDYGLSDEHHFYIPFDTTYSKNELPSVELDCAEIREVKIFHRKQLTLYNCSSK